jgi:KDO2-lipid IV(A) lauroyltransferase
MPKKKITFKHRLEYSGFMIFVLLIKLSPLFLVRFNQKLLGFLLGKIGKKYPGIVAKNLNIAFPHYSAGEIAQLSEAIYRHFVSILIEMIVIFVKKRPGKILKPIEILHPEVLEQALAKHKGVILFSGHFGNWELVPFILSRKLNRKINSIARKMDNPLVEKKVKQFREYMGSCVIDKQNAIRTILKRLENNEIVYLLMDQNTIAREAVFVDFFGEKASVVASVSQLHLKRAIPLIPVFLHYEQDKIVLELLEEIDTGAGESGKKEEKEEKMVRLTQQCTSIIEAKVRKYPEQWFWLHNRWKTRPPQEKNSANGERVKKEG